jgi:hypothetical protein
MLILAVVDMHRYTVAGIRDHLKHRVSAFVSSTEVRMMNRSPGVVCDHSPLLWWPIVGALVDLFDDVMLTCLFPEEPSAATKAVVAAAHQPN